MRPQRLDWFAVARMLGKSVKEAQALIDSREFSEWRAYLRITTDQDDRRSAELRSTMWKCHGRDYEPSDFLPDKRIYKPPTDPAELAAKLRAAFGMIHKAQQERKRKD